MNPLEFELDDGPAIEQLLRAYPEGVTVGDLEHPSEELDDKISLAQALYKEGILIIDDEASNPSSSVISAAGRSSSQDQSQLQSQDQSQGKSKGKSKKKDGKKSKKGDGKVAVESEGEEDEDEGANTVKSNAKPLFDDDDPF